MEKDAEKANMLVQILQGIMKKGKFTLEEACNMAGYTMADYRKAMQMQGS